MNYCLSKRCQTSSHLNSCQYSETPVLFISLIWLKLFVIILTFLREGFDVEVWKRGFFFPLNCEKCNFLDLDLSQGLALPVLRLGLFLYHMGALVSLEDRDGRQRPPVLLICLKRPLVFPLSLPRLYVTLSCNCSL